MSLVPAQSKTPVQLDTFSAFPRALGRNYVLLKNLGQGGMANVFLASSGAKGMQRLCALKTIRYWQNDPNVELLNKRFLEEASVVTRLSHDNLVYVFEAGLEERELYLAMEHIHGKSLADIQGRLQTTGQPFPIGLAMHIAQELLSALSYVHGGNGQRLLHRDVSPSNVMVSYAGAIKLIDFGLAKETPETASPKQTGMGMHWGKPSYVAPEQYWGRPCDHRSDLYSVGVLFWELLSGRRLFPGKERTKQIDTFVPASAHRADVPPELDRVLRIALADSPDERYQSAEEFGQAFAKFQPGNSGKTRLSTFLRELFKGDEARERSEHEQLLRNASEVSEINTSVNAAGPVQGPSDLVGTVLDGRYEVQRLLAKGSMGWVYEAVHLGIGKRVAIKIPMWSGDGDILARFVNEGATSNRVGHPNVVNVTDSGRTPYGGAFLVMEYLDGKTVEQVLEGSNALPTPRALRVALEVVKALEAAHSVGIVHRDLKPANVMLVPSDDGAELVKVLDFGVAKLLSNAQGRENEQQPTRPQTAIGTPAYMAPEQVDGMSPVDGRADIYAVGVMLFEMLSGVLPFDGRDADFLFKQKLNGAPPELLAKAAHVPPVLCELVMKALARRPQDRPATATVFRKQLEGVLAASDPPKRRKSDGSRAWWLGGAAASILVLSLGAMWKLSPNEKSPRREIAPNNIVEPSTLSPPVLSVLSPPKVTVAADVGDVQLGKQARPALRSPPIAKPTPEVSDNAVHLAPPL
jgi:eukaryotic-like serine/threonine-protein kinase